MPAVNDATVIGDTVKLGAADAVRVVPPSDEVAVAVNCVYGEKPLLVGEKNTSTDVPDDDTEFNVGAWGTVAPVTNGPNATDSGPSPTPLIAVTVTV